MATTVQFPGEPIKQTGDDVLDPLDDLLTGINLLGPDGAATGGVTAPAQSVAIIESGATALSKWWSTAVAGLGGVAAITAVATRFWNGVQGGTRIAVVAGVAGVVAASLIALAIIVGSDVRGRALGATAVYAARAKIAVEFLEASLATKVPASRAPLVITTAPPLSMADELAKLAGLHTTGVLTDEEFWAQKAKLLGE